MERWRYLRSAGQRWLVRLTIQIHFYCRTADVLHTRLDRAQHSLQAWAPRYPADFGPLPGEEVDEGACAAQHSLVVALLVGMLGQLKCCKDVITVLTDNARQILETVNSTSPGDVDPPAERLATPLFLERNISAEETIKRALTHSDEVKIKLAGSDSATYAAETPPYFLVGLDPLEQEHFDGTLPQSWGPQMPHMSEADLDAFPILVPMNRRTGLGSVPMAKASQPSDDSRSQWAETAGHLGSPTRDGGSFSAPPTPRGSDVRGHQDRTHGAHRVDSRQAQRVSPYRRAPAPDRPLPTPPVEQPGHRPAAPALAGQATPPTAWQPPGPSSRMLAFGVRNFGARRPYTPYAPPTAAADMEPWRLGANYRPTAPAETGVAQGPLPPLEPAAALPTPPVDPARVTGFDARQDREQRAAEQRDAAQAAAAAEAQADADQRRAHRAQLAAAADRLPPNPHNVVLAEDGSYVREPADRVVDRATYVAPPAKGPGKGAAQPAMQTPAPAADGSIAGKGKGGKPTKAPKRERAVICLSFYYRGACDLGTECAHKQAHVPAEQYSEDMLEAVASLDASRDQALAREGIPALSPEDRIAFSILNNHALKNTLRQQLYGRVQRTATQQIAAPPVAQTPAPAGATLPAAPLPVPVAPAAPATLSAVDPSAPPASAGVAASPSHTSLPGGGAPGFGPVLPVAAGGAPPLELHSQDSRWASDGPVGIPPPASTAPPPAGSGTDASGALSTPRGTGADAPAAPGPAPAGTGLPGNNSSISPAPGVSPPPGDTEMENAESGEGDHPATKVVI